MTDAIITLVSDSLRVSVVFAAAWLAALALRKASASTRHMVWAGAIVAALLMPGLLRVQALRVTVPSPLALWSPAFERADRVGSLVVDTRPSVTGRVTVPVIRRASDIASATAFPTARSVIAVVWVMGFVAILLRVFGGVIMTSRLRRAGRHSSAGWSEDGRTMAHALGIRGVTFTESAVLRTPIVCGVVSPVVIMPADASHWTAGRRHAVLLHELSHVKRHDCLTQMLSRFMCAVYWFHPLAWLAAHRLRVEREHACDDFVLLAGVRASEYAQHLVDVARAAVSRPSVFAPAGVAMAHSAQLEGRLMSILNPKALRTSPRAAKVSVVVFILCALATASLQVQAQAPAPTPAQAAPLSNVTFEVASIRRNLDDEGRRQQILQVSPNQPIPPGRAQTLPGGNFVGRGMSVREMIRDAYGYRNRAAADVIGGPDWIDSERYNIQAKAAVDFPLSAVAGLPPMAESALRALLAERMNLRVRFESRPRKVYEMVMGREDKRPGPNLTPSKGDCRSFYAREAITRYTVTVPDPAGAEKPIPARPCMMSISLAGVIAENLTMEEWARLLAAFPQLDTMVLDRTNVKGAFDFKLMNQTPDNPALPDVMPLLEDQLGLKLRSVQAPVEVLVIERVERPSDN